MSQLNIVVRIIEDDRVNNSHDLLITRSKSGPRVFDMLVHRAPNVNDTALILFQCDTDLMYEVLGIKQRVRALKNRIKEHPRIMKQVVASAQILNQNDARKRKKLIQV